MAADAEYGYCGREMLEWVFFALGGLAIAGIIFSSIDYDKCPAVPSLTLYVMLASIVRRYHARTDALLRARRLASRAAPLDASPMPA